MLIKKMISLLISVIMLMTAGLTTKELTEAQTQSISENKYSQAGSALVTRLIDRCYNLPLHRMNEKTDNLKEPSVWPATSLIEAMADAYRLYPDNILLKAAYYDALTKYLDKFKVENTVINTPSGEVSGVTYYNASIRNKGDYYYDDNAWICIQLLNGYEQLGKENLLEAAKRNLEFLWTGWDDVLEGGIYWDKTYTSKNTCSNGPVAIAFLWAYEITGDETYLEKGKMIYDWTNKYMRENDLFIDNITVSGDKNTWRGAYNQATLIYAGSQLYKLTGDETYYNLTKATVNASIPHMFRVSDGDINMNGNPIFKAWCIGWLARSYVMFYKIDPEKNTVPMGYLKAVLDKELETKDRKGLYDPFFCSGDKDDSAKTEILQQAGVACTFLITAYYDCILNAE